MPHPRKNSISEATAVSASSNGDAATSTSSATVPPPPRASISIHPLGSPLYNAGLDYLSLSSSRSDASTEVSKPEIDSTFTQPQPLPQQQLQHQLPPSWERRRREAPRPVMASTPSTTANPTITHTATSIPPLSPTKRLGRFTRHGSTGTALLISSHQTPYAHENVLTSVNGAGSTAEPVDSSTLFSTDPTHRASVTHSGKKEQIVERLNNSSERRNSSELRRASEHHTSPERAQPEQQQRQQQQQQQHQEHGRRSIERTKSNGKKAHSVSTKLPPRTSRNIPSASRHTASHSLSSIATAQSVTSPLNIINTPTTATTATPTHNSTHHNNLTSASIFSTVSPPPTPTEHHLYHHHHQHPSRKSLYRPSTTKTPHPQRRSLSADREASVTNASMGILFGPRPGLTPGISWKAGDLMTSHDHGIAPLTDSEDGGEPEDGRGSKDGQGGERRDRRGDEKGEAPRKSRKRDSEKSDREDHEFTRGRPRLRNSDILAMNGALHDYPSHTAATSDDRVRITYHLEKANPNSLSTTGGPPSSPSSYAHSGRPTTATTVATSTDSQAKDTLPLEVVSGEHSAPTSTGIPANAPPSSPSTLRPQPTSDDVKPMEPAKPKTNRFSNLAETKRELRSRLDLVASHLSHDDVEATDLDVSALLRLVNLVEKAVFDPVSKRTSGLDLVLPNLSPDSASSKKSITEIDVEAAPEAVKSFEVTQDAVKETPMTRDHRASQDHVVFSATVETMGQVPHDELSVARDPPNGVYQEGPREAFVKDFREAAAFTGSGDLPSRGSSSQFSVFTRDVLPPPDLSPKDIVSPNETSSQSLSSLPAKHSSRLRDQNASMSHGSSPRKYLTRSPTKSRRESFSPFGDDSSLRSTTLNSRLPNAKSNPPVTMARPPTTNRYLYRQNQHQRTLSTPPSLTRSLTAPSYPSSTPSLPLTSPVRRSFPVGEKPTGLMVQDDIKRDEIDVEAEDSSSESEDDKALEHGDDLGDANKQKHASRPPPRSKALSTSSTVIHKSAETLSSSLTTLLKNLHARHLESLHIQSLLQSHLTTAHTRLLASHARLRETQQIMREQEEVLTHLKVRLKAIECHYLPDSGGVTGGFEDGISGNGSHERSHSHSVSRKVEDEFFASCVETWKTEWKAWHDEREQRKHDAAVKWS